MEQFFKVVDKEKTEVRWQSEWFGKFTLGDVIRLASKFTMAQLMAREDFNKRYSAGQPITVAELLYPLLQAYDSVVIQSDVEFGGSDQKFNLLVGRELQSMMGQRPQQCFMTPLLVGTDGVHKMSKSLGNYIGVAEPPDQIYGKAMSIPDGLILQYFELVTDVSDGELEEFKNQLENNKINPMVLKKRLAREIVTQLYSKEAANEAEENFEKVFQKKGMPEEIPEYHLSSGIKVDIPWLLVESKLVSSRSEATRLIKQGAVETDGEKITGYTRSFKNGSVVKVGKRRYIKIAIDGEH
jgi:tyrosyl-tRNA synthetase